MKDWEIEAWKQQRQVGDQVAALMRRHETDPDEEIEDDSMYVGSDSDFSDHALGIDY